MFLRINNRYHGGSRGCQQGGKLIVEVREVGRIAEILFGLVPDPALTSSPVTAGKEV